MIGKICLIIKQFIMDHQVLCGCVFYSQAPSGPGLWMTKSSSLKFLFSSIMEHCDGDQMVVQVLAGWLTYYGGRLGLTRTQIYLARIIFLVYVFGN